MYSLERFKYAFMHRYSAIEDSRLDIVIKLIFIWVTHLFVYYSKQYINDNLKTELNIISNKIQFCGELSGMVLNSNKLPV